MKLYSFLLVVALAVAANCQDKPRVFVQGKGSQDVNSKGGATGGSHWAAWGSKSTVDSHDESMEVTKDLQKNCSGVTITINDSNADYIVMLNRESKQNRGLLRSNSQVQVANKAGDVLGSKATHTVGNAAKDACNLILADWQEHGRLNVPQQAAVPASPTPAVQPAVQTAPAAHLVTTTSTQVQDDAIAPVVPAPATQVSVADAAKQAKQRQACLDLAKDNPNITCK